MVYLASISYAQALSSDDAKPLQLLDALLHRVCGAQFLSLRTMEHLMDSARAVLDQHPLQNVSRPFRDRDHREHFFGSRMLPHIWARVVHLAVALGARVGVGNGGG